MYKMEMQLLPTLFSDMFVKNSDARNYLTRHVLNLRVASKHNTKLSEQFIGTAAISIWNKKMSPHVHLKSVGRIFDSTL